jgi:hypothetical protein
MPLPADGLMFGKGFRLQAQHTQLLEDLEREDGALPRDPGPRGGYPVLHAVGAVQDAPQTLPDEELARHTLLTGTPGSGKTRCLEFLARQAIRKREGCVVIIDPKLDRDLMRTCATEAVRQGKPWAFLSPAFPRESATMNVLDTAEQPAEVSMRVHALMPSAGGRTNEPFFENYALALIDRVAHVQQRLHQAGHPLGHAWTLAGLYPPSVMRHHLVQLVDAYLEVLGCPNTPFKTRKGSRYEHRIFHYRDRGINDVAADALIDNLEGPRDHFTKVISNLTPTFRGLVGTPLEPLLSSDPADLTWRRIAEERMVVYVGLASMLLAEDANRIGRAIIQDLIGFLGRRYAYEDIDALEPITVFVDELYEVLYPQFTTALSMSRGAKCRWVLAQQSLAHTAAKLGRDVARVLMDSCTTRLYFQLADYETAEAVSDSLGQCTIEVPQEGMSLGYGDVGGLSGGLNTVRKPTDAPLFRAAWTYALPKGEYVGRMGGVAVKGKVPLLTLRTQKDEALDGLWRQCAPERLQRRLLAMPKQEEKEPWESGDTCS